MQNMPRSKEYHKEYYKENREKVMERVKRHRRDPAKHARYLEQQRLYRERNRETASRTMECACGETIRVKNRERHYQSRKHSINMYMRYSFHPGNDTICSPELNNLMDNMISYDMSDYAEKNIESDEIIVPSWIDTIIDSL